MNSSSSSATENRNPLAEHGLYGTHNAVKGEALKSFFDSVTGRSIPNINSSNRGVNVMSLDIEKRTNADTDEGENDDDEEDVDIKLEVFNSWTFQIYFALSGALMIVEPIICALTPLDHGPLFKGSFEIDDDTMLHVYNKTNSSQLLYTEKNNHHQGPGRNVHGWSDYFIAQLCILGFSTFLHFFGTSVEALFVFGVLQGDSRKIEERKKKQDKIKSKPGGHYLDITEPTFYEKIWMVYDGAELLELILLLWGWGFIFERTGVAMLRCFRIFRLIYYFDVAEKHEQHIKKNNEHKDHFQELSTDEKQMKEQRIHYEKLMHVHDSENRGSRFLRFPHVCHIIMVYFRKLYEELFTEASRGGLIVISLFFYTTFVFALMFYNETSTLTDVDNPPTACGDLSTCYIRLMRLVFYDGNGFDFLEALVSNGYWGLSILAILYVIFSAIILLNGLIGIFGYAFSTEDDSTNVTFLTAKQGLAETRVLQAKLDDLITKLNMK